MTTDRHLADGDDIRARYAVRPVVYVPLTILLMLGFGFAFYWGLGGSILGALAGVIIAPVVMVVMIVGNWFIEWLYA